MAWSMRLIESPYSTVWTYTLKPGVENPNLSVGDCFYAPELKNKSERKAPWMTLSPNYARDWESKREPLIVVLPGGVRFCVDGCAWKEGAAYGEGWVVTGEPPYISLSPSVNIGGVYHGWVKDGVISDDIEGRTYL